MRGWKLRRPGNPSLQHDASGRVLWSRSVDDEAEMGWRSLPSKYVDCAALRDIPSTHSEARFL